MPFVYKNRLLRGAIAATFSVVAIWASCAAFIVYDLMNTRKVFMERQRGILTYTADVMLDSKKVGPFILSFFENQLSEGNLNFFRPTEEDLKVRRAGELISYGDFILAYNGKLRSVSGFLEKYYKIEDGNIYPVYPQEQRFLEKLFRRCENDSIPHSAIIKFKGRKLIVTASNIPLPNGIFTYALYADYNNILERLQFERRRILVIIWSILLTLAVAVFETMMVRSLKREYEGYQQLKKFSEDLENEIETRKVAESALRKSEEGFRLAFENAQDAIFWIDVKSGLITNANKRAEKLLERDRSEIVGCDHSIIMPFEKEKKSHIFKMIHSADAGDLDMECEIGTSSGKTIPALLSSSTTIIDGSPIVQCIIRDISHLKSELAEKELLKEQLTQSQKMEAVGTLSGGIAHDFNNLLSVIIGNTQLAMGMADPESAMYQRMGRVLKASDSARELTMKLLVFSRKDVLNAKAIRPAEAIAELVDMLKRSIPKNIKVETSVGNCQCVICADFNQLTQALLNICLNARDSMPDGGTIKISTYTSLAGDLGFRDLSDSPDSRYCVIDISDQGGGIPENLMQKIFDPFFTTKERGRGTGLGLSITRGIIESHGGRINAVNNGAGATFKVVLPITDICCANSADYQPVSATGNGEKVLVIDDEEMFSEMVFELLEKAGYKPIVAKSGMEGVSIFRERHSEISAVFLDIIMPGVNGSDVFKELRSIDPGAKVIICSGFSKDGQAENLLKTGAAGFLQKPFMSDEFFDILGKVVASA